MSQKSTAKTAPPAAAPRKAAAAAPEQLVARLKPYNPKAGYVLKRYNVGGKLYIGERNWYKVTPEEASVLKRQLQVFEDSSSKRAFDVVTLSMAKQLDRDEAARRQAMTLGGSQPELAVASSTDLAVHERQRLADIDENRGDLSTSDLNSESDEDFLPKDARPPQPMQQRQRSTQPG